MASPRRRSLLSPLRLLAEQALPSRRKVDITDVENLLEPRPNRPVQFYDRDAGVRFPVRSEEYRAAFTPEFLNELRDNPMWKDDILGQAFLPDPPHVGRTPAGAPGGYPIGRYRQHVVNSQSPDNLGGDVRVRSRPAYASYRAGWPSQDLVPDLDNAMYREMLLMPDDLRFGSTAHFETDDGRGPFAHVRYNLPHGRDQFVLDPVSNMPRGTARLHELQSDFYSVPSTDSETRRARIGEAQRRLSEMQTREALARYIPNLDDKEMWPDNIIDNLMKRGHPGPSIMPNESYGDATARALEYDRRVTRMQLADPYVRDWDLRLAELGKAQQEREPGPYERIWDRTATNAFLDDVFKYGEPLGGTNRVEWPTPQMHYNLYYKGEPGISEEGKNAYQMYERIYNRDLPSNLRRAMRNLGIDPKFLIDNSGVDDSTMYLTPDQVQRIHDVMERYGSAFPLYKEGGVV